MKISTEIGAREQVSAPAVVMAQAVERVSILSDLSAQAVRLPAADRGPRRARWAVVGAAAGVLLVTTAWITGGTAGAVSDRVGDTAPRPVANDPVPVGMAVVAVDAATAQRSLVAPAAELPPSTAGVVVPQAAPQLAPAPKASRAMRAVPKAQARAGGKASSAAPSGRRAVTREAPRPVRETPRQPARAVRAPERDVEIITAIMKDGAR